MRTVEKLLFEFDQRGDPLVNSISDEEIPPLINALRARLDLSIDQLNLTPKSLSLLARSLMECYRESEKQKRSLTDEEIIRIVRKITAYFCEVIVMNSDGKRRGFIQDGWYL